MFPWLLPWVGWFKAPLSGNVMQDISPITSWFSPQLEVNFAGDRKVEGQVVSEVASYGKQLGLLTEAVLELAEGKKGLSVDKLRQLAEQIEQVKNQQKIQLKYDVREDLNKLKQEDPAALNAILSEYKAS